MTLGQELFFEAREDWRNDGPPREAWSGSGAFWRILKKYFRTDLKGDGTGELALYSTLGGRGGSNYALSFNHSSNPSGERFRPLIGENFDIAKWTQFELEMLASSTALVSDVGAITNRMNKTGVRSHKSLSALMWSDGSGVIAKGDGLYSVAGNLITFKNILDADKFEVDDRLIFVSEANKTAAAAGVQPTPRAFADPDPAATNGFLAITAINRQTGVVTTNVNVDAAIPTAVNTDWIGIAAWFGGARKCMDGLFTYAPIRGSEAIKDLYGVVRSKDVNRLAGWRVLLSGTDSPWGIIGKMAVQAVRAFGVPDEGDSYCMFVTSNEMSRLIAQMEASSIHYIQTTAGMSDYKASLCMGVSAVQASIPGFGPIKIVADQYLTDSTVAATEDRTYCMVNEADVYFGTTAEGLNWRDYDNQGGPLHQISGVQTIYGQYGTFGNFYHLNPGHAINGSTQVNT